MVRFDLVTRKLRDGLEVKPKARERQREVAREVTVWFRLKEMRITVLARARADIQIKFLKFCDRDIAHLVEPGWFKAGQRKFFS